ncbi:polysaccharide biosynthesis protein [Thermogladius calderae 1633]|uniref:Polysaccharide biosynthesis protein n=1 Tax=Thermogladius calderae (strain DSM 22663 / VKM B-2946 / 1633) TaxID=1184251 RepID=I3TFZ2_THEC1|nr:oligosaccharide flippase family protein [Thermogladius calderae]AFK51680.1 polysaccharide biosynthesis protein [Thermogladius calderae 1633]
MSELEYTVERAGAHALLYAASTIVYLLVQVVTLMVVARLLGPANYGLYNLASIPVSVLSLLTDFGIDAAVLRYSSLYASRGQVCRVASLAKRAFLLKLTLSLSVVAPALLLAEPLGQALSSRSGIGLYVSLYTLVLVPQVLVADAASLMVGLGRAGSRTIVVIAQPLARLAAVLALFSLVGPTVENAILALAVSYVVGITVSLTLVKDVLSSRGCGFEMNEVVGYALTVYTGSVAGAVVARLQSYLLGFITAPMGVVGNSVAGYFNAAYNFLGAIGAVYGALATPLLPLFVHQSKNEEGFKGIVEAVLATLFALTLPLSLISILYSGDVIRTVYGPEYAEAGFYYTVISVSLLLWPFSVVAGSVIQAYGVKRVILLSNTISLVSGVLLYLGLGLTLGVAGLAIASALASIPVLVYQLSYLEGSGFRMEYSKYLKTAVASVLSVLASIPLTMLLALSVARLVLGFTFTALFYSVLLAALNALSDVELSFLVRISRSIPVLGWILGAYVVFYTRLRDFLARLL